MASSSQTTEILFNSPALHSLKRDQLVKLCKIHSIKASGKNVELIERLKKVAENLPKDSPLSIAARSDAVEGDNVEDEWKNDEEDKENSYRGKIDETTMKEIPRPSEKWDVMESIAECDNEDSGSRNGTLKSLGSDREFGTGSSKSSTMSSIKALASSLGLKRNTSAKSALSTSTSLTVANDSSFPERPPVVPANASLDTKTRSTRPLTVSGDELSKHATPYGSLPMPSPSQMPQTDHFSDFSHFNANPPTPSTLSKFDFNNREDSTPLPGHVLRPGAPAPDNARLSLGDARFSLGIGSPRKSTAATGPTTTIRLVSSSSMTGSAIESEPSTSFGFNDEHGDTPKLKPWNTAFDLVLGSPVGPSQGGNVKIYPDLPMDDIVTSPTKSKSTVPGSLSLPPPNPASPGPASPSAKPEPFIFGSPLPQHRVSDAQFQSAAASVLEEMNRRLQADGLDTVGTSLISNLRPGSRADLSPNTRTDREIKPLRKSFGVKSKFEKAHQDQFEGMESIAGYLDRKNKITAPSLYNKGDSGPSSSAVDDEPVQVGKKRKSNVLGDARPVQVKRPSTRVISNTRRAIPGGFGDEEEEEEAQAPAGKKARVEFSQEDSGEKDNEEVDRTEKEREAIRRKLEMNRARRRSSAANARASMGRGRASVGRNSLLHKPPPKPAASKSRFGFLSGAAKSLMKGVWGGSKKTLDAPAPAPTSKPAPPAPNGTTSSNAPSIATGGATKSKIGPFSSGAQRKVSAAGSGPLKTARGLPVPSTSSRSSNNRNVSNSGTMTSLGSVAATIHSAHSRSPIPSFAAPTRSSSIRTSTTGTASTRNSSVASRTAGSSIGGTGVSRKSAILSSRVSSLGTRGTGTSRSSRLLAPTASSLAKSAGVTKLKSNASNVPTTKPSEALSPSSPGSSTNTPGKIFSKPLVAPVGSGLPSPVRSGSAQTITVKQRSLSGRKPRISRSKVIAKLASQRTASGSGASGPSAVGLAAKRSSLGAGVHKAPRKSTGGARRSHFGVSGTRTSEASVLLSAKKRARQSEYARRRSRVPGGSNVGVSGSGAAADAVAMDVA